MFGLFGRGRRNKDNEYEHTVKVVRGHFTRRGYEHEVNKIIRYMERKGWEFVNSDYSHSPMGIWPFTTGTYEGQLHFRKRKRS